MSDEPTIQELFSLSGKTALISGASGWLGRSLSRALAEAGASVVVTSRDAVKAEKVVATLPSPHGAPHFGVGMDQLDEASARAGFDRAVELAGGIDILVNNGHEANASDLTSVTREEFNRTLENATGYFLLARMLRDHAVGQGKPANVILIGSMYGVVGSYPEAYEGVVPASPVAYHALKGGIVHMTRHLAVYWAKDDIRVNCLSPGPFPGPKANPDMVARLEKKSPMARMGRPGELKGAVVFLASDAASYVTGQNLLVDGGWTAW